MVTEATSASGMQLTEAQKRERIDGNMRRTPQINVRN